MLADADLDLAVEQAVRGTLPEHRPELHRRQALHRRRSGRGRVRAALCRRRRRAARSATRATPPTRVGPLARPTCSTTLERQVAESVQQGAVLRVGGYRLDRPGYFFAPTVLTGVEPAMTAFTEETFGPVAAVTRFADEPPPSRSRTTPATGSAHRSGAATPDAPARSARQIDSGAVFVNTIVASDPRLPFGGVKRSGYGRELAAHGLREFTNIRTYRVGA